MEEDTGDTATGGTGYEGTTIGGGGSEVPTSSQSSSTASRGGAQTSGKVRN